ncbi:MAG: MBL fold metallo-hydrolase [Alphaproteobacteria bacterium]|nr:MBL fold metallo-hydrolase [Alphaproteobacteria bacterium]
MSFEIKFWGVRGTIPTPYHSHLGFGGNTSCVEIHANGHRIILDAGTGIRSLGAAMQRDDGRKAHLLLSHTHLDHINGFPFFAPVFSKETALTIMAGHLADQGGVQHVLQQHLAEPNFPIPVEKMGALMDFVDFRAGDAFALGPEVTVRTAPLNHPYGATGYRIEHAGKSACYVTDTEHTPGRPDQNVLGLIEGADLFIYDCTYTDQEFGDKAGWGHSTWQEGMRLAKAANVGTFVIFHHEPDHDDTVMAAIEQEARQNFPGAIAAREGMKIRLR